MKGSKVEFVCKKCNQNSVHYCRGMCNPCYQRHLRQKNKSRTTKIQTAKAQTPAQRMKRDDYPYTPPKVGDLYQVDQAQFCRHGSEERQVESVHKRDCIDFEEMTEYLHFCKVVFTDSMTEGDIVKGSGCLEEQALKLLRECSYNTSRAKLAILYPIEYKLEPCSFDRITEDEAKRKVQQATLDLEEIKEEKREDYSKKMMDSLKAKVTKEDLEMMVQVARSIRVAIPAEVEQSLEAADQFSTDLSGMLEKKNLKSEEVERLAEKAAQFSVITPTIAHIQQLARDCKEWMNKATIALNGRPSTKQLQALTSEGTSLQIDLPQLEVIKDKYKKTKKWAESIHALTKPGKFNKEFVKPNVSQIHQLLEESKLLNFTHCEIPALESQVELVSCWKERLLMWTEDTKGEKMNMEELNDLMQEYEKLPFRLDTVLGLNSIKEVCQWTLQTEALLKDGEKMHPKQLKAMLLEANRLNVSSALLKKIESLIQSANAWKTKAKQILKHVEPISLEELSSFYQSGLDSRVDLDPLLKQIAAKAARAQQWKFECDSLLSQDPQLWNIDTITKLQHEMKDLFVVSDPIQALFSQVQVAQEWKIRTISFLGSFPKNEPSDSDYDLMVSLVQDCPGCMMTSGAMDGLRLLREKMERWQIDCEEYLQSEHDQPETVQLLLVRANFHPVTLPLYSRLLDHSSLADWKHSAEIALQTTPTAQAAKYLLRQADNRHFPITPIYISLREAVDKMEALRLKLRQICARPTTLQSLLELHKEAQTIPLQFEEQKNLRLSLLSHLSFQERAQEVLSAPRSYTQCQCLLEEGEFLCCGMSEVARLEALVKPCSEWKQKVDSLLSQAPGLHFDLTEDAPAPTKRRLTQAEYKIMDKTDDVLGDLIRCVENAYTEEVLWNPNIVQSVHPVQGISWIITFPSSKLNPNLDSKRKRVARQRIKDLESALDIIPRREQKRQVDLRLLDNPQNLCFCQSGEQGDMIQCGRCKAWFHLTCLGLEARSPGFVCEVCCKRRDEIYEWPRPWSHAVSLQTVKEWLIEAQTLPLVLPEVQILSKLSDRAGAWQKRAEEMIVAYESHQQLDEEAVVHLLQEYEGLPVHLPEKDRLVAILQSLDWLQEAKSNLYDKTSMRILKKLIKSATEIHAENNPEMVQLLRGLENKRASINHWTEMLQQLLAEKAGLQEIKRFLDEPEVKKLQFEKFENLKKDAAQTELLAAKVAEALQNKRSDLAALEKLQVDVLKSKIPHEVFNSLAVTIGKMKAWVEDVRKACEDGCPSTEVLKQLLTVYQDISCSHPLVSVLEQHIGEFCLCKQPDTGEKPMINCDSCKDWFHYDCVGIPQEIEVEGLGDYMCPRCCAEKQVEYKFSIVPLSNEK